MRYAVASQAQECSGEEPLGSPPTAKCIVGQRTRLTSSNSLSVHRTVVRVVIGIRNLLPCYLASADGQSAKNRKIFLCGVLRLRCRTREGGEDDLKLL